MNNESIKIHNTSLTTQRNKQTRAPFDAPGESFKHENKIELGTVTAYDATLGHTVSLRNADGSAGPTAVNVKTWPKGQVFNVADEVFLVFRGGVYHIIGLAGSGAANTTYTVTGWLSTCTE